MAATQSVTPAALEAVRPFRDLRVQDVDYAGGKGANLGELTAAGLPVPPGFVIGAPAYATFCEQTGLRSRLCELLDNLDVEDTTVLAQTAKAASVFFDETPIPDWLASQIRDACVKAGIAEVPVAVRSSATAEDTASASFAGMNETFLNVVGADAVLDAVRRCWRSLFGARTVYYRGSRGFGQAEMDIAVIVQQQIAATRSGVMFTANPATGDHGELVIESAFGLGEAVVSGSVSPDRYLIKKEDRLSLWRRDVHYKELAIEFNEQGGTRTRQLSREEGQRPTLDESEVLAVADLGVRVEAHYGAPQDTEWAFDPDGNLWILQSRPITALAEPGIHAKGACLSASVDPDTAVEPVAGGAVLLRGLGGAPGSASGAVRVLSSLKDAEQLREGEVLVTHMTAPDWVPLMRRAAAIVTDSGGMTCHAAIVSRELAIPAVVGTGEATSKLRDGEIVTVDATKGVVLEGASASTITERTPTTESAPASAASQARVVTGTQVLVNLSEPSQVKRAASLDVDGVGLLRAELMVLEALGGDHPRTLLEEGRGEEFITAMADGLSVFASAFAPRPITYRTIDFRTNEFRGLRGGERFEPQEANPMIGYRGALRYTQDPDVFALELAAVGRVWEQGQRNLHVMLPFVRTSQELRRCRELIGSTGLLEHRGFELWVMAEVPSVLFNLADYAALGVAGISIGSNDLTQLLLGADRDSELLAQTFDERDPAVVAYLQELIPRARELGLRTSICGQAPSVHPEYAELLVRAGIDCVSVNIDVVDRTRALIAAAEQRVLLDAARE